MWRWEQYGDNIRLTSTLRGLETHRIFRLNEPGKNKKEWFWQQCLEAQNDLLTRLEFIFMAQAGMLDDPDGGVEINGQ